MSFRTFNERVKNTQRIIDAYLGTDLALGSHDPFTMVDQLRAYLGYDVLFGNFARIANQTDLAAYLSGQLTEIGTKSAIVGDITAINQDGVYTLGIAVGHDYSLFVVSNNQFGLVPNKHLTHAWRVGGEV